MANAAPPAKIELLHERRCKSACSLTNNACVVRIEACHLREACAANGWMMYADNAVTQQNSHAKFTCPASQGVGNP